MILNLANPSETQIKFKIQSFPDGQHNIIIEDEIEFEINSSVTIKSRLNNFIDLEIILCATQALREMGCRNIELYVPYIIGARSDRKFIDGSVNYVKNIISPILNSQNYSTIYTIDPHSDVLEACLNRFQKEDNYNLVSKCLDHIRQINENQFQPVLVSPDAGALKKIYNISKKVGITDIILASKNRDPLTGNILGTVIDIEPQYLNYDFVIIDDICDGGGTFIQLAKKIKEKAPNAKIYLIITHGIFSAGLDVLKEHLNLVCCTNSIKTVDSEFVYQVDVF